MGRRIRSPYANLTTPPEGLRPLGGGTTDSGSGKSPGLMAPLAVYAATANPLGLVVVGGLKAYDLKTGRSSVEGDAKRTADAIAERLEAGARKQGWI